MRNQLNPNNSNGVFRLKTGATYTWSFQTVTHMGMDAPGGTQRLVWQIHDYATGGSPVAVLGIENHGTQSWYVSNGGGKVDLPYTDGAVDNWVITAVISCTGSGHLTAQRNGSTVFDRSGATYGCASSGAPWWNMGPYQWNWIGHGAASRLSRVEILFNSMVLTQG
jgi:hypothetical protein